MIDFYQIKCKSCRCRNCSNTCHNTQCGMCKHGIRDGYTDGPCNSYIRPFYPIPLYVTKSLIDE